MKKPSKNTRSKRKLSRQKKKHRKLHISRKKGMKFLDPMSTGIIMSSMLNDKSLHNLSMTSKRNVGVSTGKILKKRKEYMEKKKLENKMIKFQFTNKVESLTGGEYTYELQDYFYNWKDERNRGIDNNMDMENDEDFDEIEREFIMTFFYPRIRYNVKYVVICPSLTKTELGSINVDTLKTILNKCLSNSKSEYYKVDDDHYSLDGGLYSISKTQFKTENKL